jgi:hypothetical protein
MPTCLTLPGAWWMPQSVMPALYMDSVAGFVASDPAHVLGSLTAALAEEGFGSTTPNTFSWQQEITELQTAFRRLTEASPLASQWQVLLEYVLPIIGKRVDCVLLAEDMAYVIEYKDGASSSARSALRQAQDYAWNLVDFHEASRHRIAIPIAVGTFRTVIPVDVTYPSRGCAVTPGDLPATLLCIHKSLSGRSTAIETDLWNNSRYFPVPTIIEAASAIFGDHNVKELAHSRAGTDNLEATQRAVAEAVADARHRSIRKLVVVTGVPGAGKTLAGLNAVQFLIRQLDLEVEQAAFLSGNGPLVKVLQEALKRDAKSRGRAVVRSVQSRIREVHRFIRDSYGNDHIPADRLIVFDEAQRAWTSAKNLKKFGRDVSEPEMALEIMGRHEGWSVIVALVGGGQEIHGGEAGLAAWGDAISRHPEWEVITSPEAMLGGPSVAGSRLFRDGSSHGAKVKMDPRLHLAISKRSYGSEITAAWVNAVLDGRQHEAREMAAGTLPVYITRDLRLARHWLTANSTGSRRAGLIASSGAMRLRAEGVETPTFDFLGGIDYVKWFLEPAGDYRSSNQLEVALSEFEMQGLEIDVAGLLWGGDLVFPDSQVVARKLKGLNWCAVGGIGDPQLSADDPRTRIQNKYRVLLTRFRKAMVIFVPTGSPGDPTRAAADFDSVYEYLLNCGVSPLR